MRSVLEHTVTPGPVALTTRRENFAQAYAAHGNASRAYRESFDCAASSPATVRQRAYELAHEPTVAARIRSLLAEAADGALIDARSRMVTLRDIVEADPGELVRIVADSCRCCWSTGHRPGWRSTDEYCDACEEAVRTGKPAPSCDGGFAYDPRREPNPDCPECRGDGLVRAVITPTDRLSPSARRLLKGVRVKANGEIEVRTHDQLAAADMLNKMQGVYIDRSVSLNVNATLPAPKDLTPEQALAYLDRLKPLP